MLLETRSITKAVKYLLIVNIGVYLFLLFTKLSGWGIAHFSLIPVAVTQHAQIWRLFTYGFLHANIFPHLFFNMFALWMFGPQIERKMGTSQFIFYYFLASVGGALFSLLLAPSSSAPIIGASGSIFGLLVAFAMLFPNAIISMIFPPVSLKAKHFVMIFGAIQFLMLFDDSSGIGWAAHAGGILIGFLYMRYMLKGKTIGLFDFSKIKSKLYTKKPAEKPFSIEKEVDPILDKISRVGMKGLSRKERQILEKAQKKMK